MSMFPFWSSFSPRTSDTVCPCSATVAGFWGNRSRSRCRSSRLGSSKIARVRKPRASNWRPKRLGQADHCHRIATGLFPLVELLVASPKPVDFSFLAAQLRGLSRLPVLLRQQDKPVNGRRIGRIRHEQAFQLSAFRFNITLLGGEPGIEPMELGRHRLRGWQVRYGRI